MKSEIETAIINGDVSRVIAMIDPLTKDQLEDCSGDLLMMSVAQKLKQVTDRLLKKGLRSGNALVAAIFLNDVQTVRILLDYGVIPCPNAEHLARDLKYEFIASTIRTKRDSNNAFRTDIDF